MLRKILSYPFLITIIAWNIIFAILGVYLPEWIDLFALRYPAGGVSLIADIVLDIFRLFSYTFVHTGALHLISNMLWLIIFCIPIHPVINYRRVMAIYFGSGAVAGIFFLLSAGIWDTHIPVNLCGASGAVLGVCTAAVVLNPDYRFKLGFLSHIPIYIYTIIAVILTFFASPDPYSLIAHVGGVTSGILLAFIFKVPAYKNNNRPSATHNKY
ncbi:MAG: rhomboid family intramembrane serine protease [Muribaculaceae bacterium]|nr:rhomboid family intramembrane serine protease [Muribaculaceae bacterium]